MRIKTAAIVLATLLASPAPAQLRAGALGGLTFPSFTDQSRQYETQTRFQAGLLASWSIGRIFAVQPEFYYSQRASKQETGGDNGAQASSTESDTAITSIRLDYFEIPGLIRLNLAPSAGLYIAGGPAVAVRLRCAITVSADGKVERDKDCAYRGLELIDQTNVGWVIGSGIQLKLGAQPVGGDIRLISGWTAFENASTMRLDQAFDNSSIAVTGRWLPVIK